MGKYTQLIRFLDWKNGDIDNKLSKKVGKEGKSALLMLLWYIGWMSGQVDIEVV